MDDLVAQVIAKVDRDPGWAAACATRRSCTGWYDMGIFEIKDAAQLVAELLASPAIPFTRISAITRRNWPNNNDEPARGRHEHETHRNERTMDRLYYPAQA